MFLFRKQPLHKQTNKNVHISDETESFFRTKKYFSVLILLSMFSAIDYNFESQVGTQVFKKCE